MGVIGHLLPLSLFHTLCGRLSGFTRRVAWILFVAITWSLWHIRNKALIEGILLEHPADGLYKLTIFLQLWKTLSKQSEAEAIKVLCSKLRAHAMALREEGTSQDG